MKSVFYFIVNSIKYLIIGAIILLGIILISTFKGADARARLQNEIERVAGDSNVKAASVVCKNVETALICYADYPSLSSNLAKQMLAASGYTLVSETTAGSISATNQSKAIRVDSETAVSSGGVTLKFKDINVTL